MDDQTVKGKVGGGERRSGGLNACSLREEEEAPCAM